MGRRHFASRRDPKTKDRQPKAFLAPVTEQLISSLRGCCKGKDSLVEALHLGRQEKSFAERTWGAGKRRVM